MLPPSHQIPYQSFQEQIENFQQTWIKLDRSEAMVKDPSESMATLAQLSEFFHSQILNLDETLLDPSTAQKVRTYQTEIHKQLQLLKMDLTFWFAARQLEKRLLRSQQITERFATLRRYLNTTLSD